MKWLLCVRSVAERNRSNIEIPSEVIVWKSGRIEPNDVDTNRGNELQISETER